MEKNQIQNESETFQTKDLEQIEQNYHLFQSVIILDHHRHRHQFF